MPPNKTSIWRRFARGGCIVLLLTAGCCHHRCWGKRCYKEGGLCDPGQIPAPNGSFVNAWHDAQANRAEASDFTFYITEWFRGGTELGPFGVHHLGDIVRRLPTVPFPVVIEPHLDARLNEARRQIIVTALLNQGITDADMRVVVAYPQSEGLYGEEAEAIYADMFLNRSGNSGLYGGRGRSQPGGGFGGYRGYGGGMGGFIPDFGVYSGYGGGGYGWGRGTDR